MHLNLPRFALVSNPGDFLKRVYNDPYVITLDEVGDFKHWPASTLPYVWTGQIRLPFASTRRRVTRRWGNIAAADVPAGPTPGADRCE